MDISIVSSLHGSQRHLVSFLRRAEACIRHLEGLGFSAQSVVVSNDPSRSERRALTEAFASSWWQDHGKLLVVPRETLYASWNRGVRASLGSAICFWNVDDYRNPAALVEGLELIRRGAKVVGLPWVHISTERNLLGATIHQTVVFNDRKGQAGLNPSIDFCLGPFFMVDREGFETYGGFDEQFHIAGDYDWQLRVVPHTGLEWGESLGGVFLTDGTNLSGSCSPRLLVEQNVLFRRYGLDRAPWHLDTAAEKLSADYGDDRCADGVPSHDWSFDATWRRRKRARRVLRQCRHLAAAPIRVIRSRRRWSR
jgi:hypothetical protein